MALVCEAVEPARPCAGSCGKSFVPLLRAGPTIRFCSETCRGVRREKKQYDRICACSRTFVSFNKAKLYCGRECQSAGRSAKITEIWKAKGPPEHRKRVCENPACRKPFVAHRPGAAARAGLSADGKYCSRRCSQAERSRVAKERNAASSLVRQPQVRLCLCGSEIVGLRRLCAPCTRERRLANCRIKNDALRRSEREAKRAYRKCGDTFVPAAIATGRTYRRIFCSQGCGEAYHKGRAGTNHRKRARYHGVAYEYINILKVLERDNWRCQVCGVATPKRLRGTTDDRAPELDHRIPMAMGGGHVWSNVQCACRRCNAFKGGTIIAGQTNFLNVLVEPRRHRQSVAAA